MLHRDRRAAETIKVEVAQVITNELADPKLGFVTVVGAKLTKDLKRAIIYISVIGDDQQRKDSVEHLEKAKGYIKKQLSSRLVVRYMPEIHFEYDVLLEQERHVSELIQQLHKTEAGPDKE
jgi:ribosome-binding factor A